MGVMKRAFIACGGTGGHLAPGIALAEELISRGVECELLISRKEVDSRLARKYEELSFCQVQGQGFSLSPARFVKFIIGLGKGMAQMWRKIKKEKPDVVIGFGGFLSVTTLLTSHALGVPVAIHESNRVPGKATRLAGMFARRIYLPDGVEINTAHISGIRHVGMPTRREIRPLSKQRARHLLGLDQRQKLLLVFGGSQGAKALNDWVKSNLESLAQDEIQVYCLMGATGGSDSEFSYMASNGSMVTSIFRRFSDDMATVLSAADLAVSRAGSGSIADIARCRVPAILIPYPHAADNHQLANAQYFERRGGGFALSQDYLVSLLDEVRDTIYNDWLLQRFKSNLRMMRDRPAQAYMADDMQLLIEESRVSETAPNVDLASAS